MNVRILVILIYLVAVLIFAFLVNISHYLGNVFCTGDEDSLQVYDYIIVGAGSAGSLIAQRLSADQNVSVLLLEAGHNVLDLLKIPAVALMLQQTSYDWQYRTVPQQNACLALDDHVSLWPMGKMVGGTGMLNNMMHVRGNEEDFIDWFEFKNKYNYTRDILPCFTRLEIFSNRKNGVIQLSDPPYLTVLPEYLRKASKNLGFSDLTDPTEANVGVGIPKLYLQKGQRWTSASRLKTLNRPNLILKTNRMVEKILLTGDFEATGVKYHYCQKSYNTKARKGVILSAGVIGSAKILMQSGIGRKNHLSEIGIKTKVDLPVGDNLQDHVTTGIDLVLLNTSLDLHIENILSPLSALKYFSTGDGPWTTAGCELFIYSNSNISKNSENSRPDLQLMVMPLAVKEDEGVYLRKLMGISDHSWYKYFNQNKEQVISILPVLLHPKSRGTVRLQGKDFKLKPLIDPQYLSDPEDIQILVDGIEIIKNLVESEEMRKLGAKINNRIFPGCEAFEFDTKPYWECYVRHLTITSYHPVGTCKMGAENDPTAVVNYNFQVKNTNKLYISDGSIIPNLTSGNINGAILLAAEMASDKIREIDYLSTKKCHILNIFLINRVC